MKKNRIQLDDLQANAAAELTEADVSRITGGATHTGGVNFLLADGSVRLARDVVPTDQVSLNYSKVEWE